MGAYSVYSVVHKVAACGVSKLLLEAEVAELLLEPMVSELLLEAAVAELLHVMYAVWNTVVLKSIRSSISTSKRSAATVTMESWSRYLEGAKQCALSLSTEVCGDTVLCSGRCAELS